MWIYGFIIIIHVRGWWRFHFWKGHVSVKYPLYGLHVCKLLNVTFGVFIHNIWNGLIAVNDWGIFTFNLSTHFRLKSDPFSDTLINCVLIISEMLNLKSYLGGLGESSKLPFLGKRRCQTNCCLLRIELILIGGSKKNIFHFYRAYNLHLHSRKNSLRFHCIFQFLLFI